jgi:hypothetical protein
MTDMKATVPFAMEECIVREIRMLLEQHKGHR